MSILKKVSIIGLAAGFVSCVQGFSCYSCLYSNGTDDTFSCQTISGSTPTSDDTIPGSTVCLTKVIYNNTDNTILEVQRGFPWIETEWMLANGVNGTTCTQVNQLTTCRKLCSSDSCNNDDLGTSPTGFLGEAATRCGTVDCTTADDCTTAVITGSDQCTGIATDLYTGSCWNLIEYDGSGNVLSNVKQCGEPDLVGYGVVINPTQSSGFCAYGATPTTTTKLYCSQLFASSLPVSDGQYINTLRAVPNWQQNSCLQCEAGADTYQFQACLTASSTNGVSTTVCPTGVNECVTSTIFDKTGSVLGIQRGCGTVNTNSTADSCSWFNTVESEKQVCSSACAISKIPCNSGLNTFVATTTASPTTVNPNATTTVGPSGAGFQVGVTAVFLGVMMLMV